MEPMYRPFYANRFEGIIEMIWESARLHRLHRKNRFWSVQGQ